MVTSLEVEKILNAPQGPVPKNETMVSDETLFQFLLKRFSKYGLCTACGTSASSSGSWWYLLSTASYLG